MRKLELSYGKYTAELHESAGGWMLEIMGVRSLHATVEEAERHFLRWCE